MKKCTFPLLAAGVVLAGLAATIIFAFLPPTPVPGREGVATIKVLSGQTVSEIGDALKNARLIRSSKLFDILILASGASKKIQTGTYKINISTPLMNIVQKFVKGDVSKIVVTIPEGYTSAMIADLLEKSKVCTKKDFLAVARDHDFARSLGIDEHSLEGFLFPDTYYFQEDENPKSIAATMVAQFKKSISRIVSFDSMKFSDLFAKVTLASIVEREYRIPSEAPLIASVFLNRLKIGMALQSCATVVYVMTEQYGMPHPDVVYYSDLSLKSAYNTYLHRDLPPGPISNPGMVSLNAVFNPAKSDYLYFRLADPNRGMHVFSKTFQEHSLAATRVKGF